MSERWAFAAPAEVAIAAIRIRRVGTSGPRWSRAGGSRHTLHLGAYRRREGRAVAANESNADDATRPARLRLAAGAHVAEADIGFEFVSSSGPGGQNVNKRATKARLRVRIDAIDMPPGARARLRALAGSLVNDAGEIVIASDEERSQRRNREAALARLRTLVARAMVRPTPRKKTKPSRGAIERRLQAKRERSQTKARRRDKPGPGDG